MYKVKRKKKTLINSHWGEDIKYGLNYLVNKMIYMDLATVAKVFSSNNSKQSTKLEVNRGFEAMVTTLNIFNNTRHIFLNSVLDIIQLLIPYRPKKKSKNYMVWWWEIYLTKDTIKPFWADLPSNSPVFPRTTMTSTNSSPANKEKGRKKKKAQSLPDFAKTKLGVILKRKPDHHNVKKAWGFSDSKPRNDWSSLPWVCKLITECSKDLIQRIFMVRNITWKKAHAIEASQKRMILCKRQFLGHDDNELAQPVHSSDILYVTNKD